MTILQASLDRSTVDDVDVDMTDAPIADLLGAAERRTFRAATLEEAVAAAASELGDAVTVIEANRIRRGGLGGFFATDLGVEVVVEKSPSASGSTVDAVDRLLDRFGERDADSFTPSIDRVELSGAAQNRTVDAASVAPQAATPQAATPQAATRQEVARQEVAKPHTAAAVSERIESALRSEAPTPKIAPVVDDDGPIFDLSDDDWDDEGPIFDLSDDDDRPADAVFGVDDETPVAAQRPTLLVDDDDVFAPVAAERHPFADQLEAELQAMSSAAEAEVAADLVEPAVDPIVDDQPGPRPAVDIESVVETETEVRAVTEPAIAADLVEAPRNSPPPILDMVATTVGEPPAIAPIELIELIQLVDAPTARPSFDLLIGEAVEANRVTSGSGPAVTEEVATAAVDTADATIDDAEEADTEDVETEDAALADLDALLRRAGVDPLAIVDVDVDLAPTLVDRPSPSPMPSSGLVFDAADRLSEQLNAIDALSGRNEGLRRMQVKITGPDGTLVEMSAEWDGRG